MLDKNNAYLESLEKVSRDWSAAKDERDARKQQILEDYGCGSEELKAWYKEDAEATFPFGSGVSKAYRAWKESLYYGEDEVEMRDFLWEKEVEDFVNTFRKAGIKTFVYTNQSTAVMRNLHEFAAFGCSMQDLCTVTRRDNSWGEEDEKVVVGVRFMVGDDAV